MPRSNNINLRFFPGITIFLWLVLTSCNKNDGAPALPSTPPVVVIPVDPVPAIATVRSWLADPYKGHPAEADFISFKNDPYLIFGDKLPNMYELK